MSLAIFILIAAWINYINLSLARALERADEIGVRKVFGASRRYAENRFKAAVGRTIMEEIRRVKLQRVCALLSETNLSIGEITRQCDFARESHLAYIFRKHYGMPMREYRVSTSS